MRDGSASCRRRVPPLPRTRRRFSSTCVTCHNQRLKTGGLALDALDIANLQPHAETWENVVRKLRVGAMPPHGVRRPDQKTTDSLIAWLEGELDRTSTRSPGRPVLRRLNRAEYANAIRDLLGLDVDVAALLPPDVSAFGFDNVSDAQGSSPALLQAYLAAARKISASAVGDPRIATGSDTYSVRQDLSQDAHLDGLPLGTVGGMRATHTFPVDGEYEFQVRLYRTNLSAIRGLEDPHDLELTLDEEPILRASIGGEKDLIGLQTNPTDTSDALEASRLRVRRSRESRATRYGRGVSRRDAAALRDQSSAAVHPRLLEPLRCRRRAARPVDHRSRAVRREDGRRPAKPACVHLQAGPWDSPRTRARDGFCRPWRRRHIGARCRTRSCAIC